MKNRITKILGTIIAIVAIAAFDICLRYAQNRLLIATGILLTIAAVLVAFIDEKTRRSRKYEPLDYTVVKGIRVKERYCTLGEENLVVLTLYNPSRRTATVTVEVTFFNVAGKVLGTETQTIHGMVRGMEKHLCFRPEREFHSFTYNLEASSYRGICHERAFRADYFRVTTPLSPASPHKGLCPMELEIFEEYTGTTAVEVACCYLLLDKEDTVRGLRHTETRTLTSPFGSRAVTASSFEISTEGNIPLGEELGGIGLTGLCVYSVTPIRKEVKS